MGRGGPDCSEGGAAVRRSPPCRSERLLGLAGVDQLFEPAADLLACREEIVVAPPAGREMHDANTVVALAVTASVGGRLVEGPEAVDVAPQPRHRSDTYHAARPSGTRPRRPVPQFADESLKRSPLSTSGLTGFSTAGRHIQAAEVSSRDRSPRPA